MAKKFSNTRCVYCLEHFEELTSDHVLPKAWYPDNMPESLEKWQVPACHKCNWEHGRNEEELLLKLGLHFDPRDGNFKGIAKKVVRSMSPSHGKTKRDREKRRKRKNHILKEIRQVLNLDFSKSNILPGFGYDPKFSPHRQIPLLVPEKELHKFSEKVTRGVFYLVNNNIYIESDCDCKVYVPAENFPQECRQVIRQYGKEYNCGPGIGVIMAVCFDDARSAILEISIWDRLKICSVITPRKPA